MVKTDRGMKGPVNAKRSACRWINWARLKTIS